MHAALAFTFVLLTACLALAQDLLTTRPAEIEPPPKGGPAAPATLPAPPGFGHAVYGNGQLLVDYDPPPELKVPATVVERAKFPAVDVHCHWTPREDPAALRAAMRKHNISAAINLSGGAGDDLRRAIARAANRPGEPQLLFLCNLRFERCGEPGWDDYVSRTLRDARAAGAVGLKIYKSLGLTTRDVHNNLISVDDPRLDVVWQTCGELDFPVLIHSADPAAFFRPADRENERWMQLQRHPDWAFFGPPYPARAEVLAQRDRMVARHPGTRFVGAHMGSLEEDLKALGETLDRLPNFSVDLSGREAELGRQPYSARKFFLKYGDRVLFGTDRYPGRPDQPRYAIYFRFLETDDEYFKYYDHPFAPTGEWRIYGLYLSDEVLRKVYHENAQRVFGVKVDGA